MSQISCGCNKHVWNESVYKGLYASNPHDETEIKRQKEMLSISHAYFFGMLKHD